MRVGKVMSWNGTDAPRGTATAYAGFAGAGGSGFAGAPSNRARLSENDGAGAGVGAKAGARDSAGDNDNAGTEAKGINGNGMGTPPMGAIGRDRERTCEEDGNGSNNGDKMANSKRHRCFMRKSNPTAGLMAFP